MGKPNEAFAGVPILAIAATVDVPSYKIKNEIEYFESYGYNGLWDKRALLDKMVKGPLTTAEIESTYYCQFLFTAIVVSYWGCSEIPECLHLFDKDAAGAKMTFDAWM